MSKTESADGVELPDGQVYFNLRSDSDKRQFAACQQAIADRRGVDTDELTNVDVFRALADRFLEMHKLRNDLRVEETVAVIAQDHDCSPEDVSLECAFKIAAGAYTGFEQTDDWQVGGND